MAPVPSSSSFLLDSASFPPLNSSLLSASTTSSSVPSSSSTLASGSALISTVPFDPHSLNSNWSSLFKSLPRNAGSYKPIHFDIPRDKPNTVLPDVVKEEGIKYWNDHLVGFFLDGTLSFLSVVNFLKRFWKLKGDVDFKSDGYNFYFKFSNHEDRDLVLESDPIFIRGRMFIITKWDPSIGLTQAQIKKVPIWIHFHRIPIILWTLVGINWLACHVGRLICFDSSTEKLQRFKYAKALVEISPDCDLPSSIHIPQLGSNCPDVQLSYDWKPSICTHCKVFGHNTLSCEFVNKQSVGRVDCVTADDNNHLVGMKGDSNQVDIKVGSAVDVNWKIVNKKNKGAWKQKKVVSMDRNNFTNDASNQLKKGKEVESVVLHNNSSCSSDNNNSFAVLNDTSLIANNNSACEDLSSKSTLIQSISSSAFVLNNLPANNDVSYISETNGKSSLSASLLVSSVPPISSASTSSSCSSQFSTKSSILNSDSPYLHLSPPNNIVLPPPSASIELSDSQSVKNIVSNSDDLDKGKNFKPHEVLPLSKSNSHHRHTRKNPTTIFPPLPSK
jgi:hypothetical protein